MKHVLPMLAVLQLKLEEVLREVEADMEFSPDTEEKWIIEECLQMAGRMLEFAGRTYEKAKS
jgi:hypothetical protein